MSSGLDKAIKDFIQIMKEMNKKGTSPLDAQAEVLRIDEDGTAWVHLPGGVDETPVRLTINADIGDKVQVRLSGGRAWITGNQTAPPTDDKTAVFAKNLANIAGNRAKTAQKAADKAQITANSALKGTKDNAAQMAQMVIAFNEDIESLQDQIDGNITTWFYAVDPTNSNLPASEWIEEGTESVHLGDLYYNTISGYAWRWQVVDSAYSWQRISDTDVTKALADAAAAQDTADQKRRVFYSQPTPPYDAGDLWVQGSGGDILRCAQAKTDTGSYDRNDWVLASKYTDDTALNTWIAGDFANIIEELEEGIVDAKVETYYQTSDPSTNWTSAQKSEHEGDLWYNSTASVQKYYRWSGTAWQELTATPPQAVFDNIDGKATIFTGSTTPSNPSTGDLWFKSANDPILTYVNNSWVEYNKYTDDSATEALSQNIEENYSTTEETYGEIQGAIEEIQTYTFYKYASDGTGTGFSDNTSLQYRGVYTSIENEASTNPRDYKWEINPVWAAQVAENYIEDEVSENGFRIISPDPSTYARFTALFMAFFMNDILQMRMGYDSVNEVYGVMAHDIFALGSGAGVKFDGGSESTVRGRFVQEIRDNGHWSLKRY